jgi:hypothetical protein
MKLSSSKGALHSGGQFCTPKHNFGALASGPIAAATEDVEIGRNVPKTGRELTQQKTRLGLSRARIPSDRNVGSSYTVPGSIKLPKVLNQQFREDSDLSRRVVPRWSDDEDPDFGERIVIHQRYQSAGRELFLGQKIRQRGDAEPGDGCRRKSHPVVGFESTVRVHANRLISFNEVPGLCALRETFMRQQLVRRFGSPMLPDIFGAGDELAVNRRDPPCDQVRVAEVSDANCAVKTFADDVDETVTVARMNVKARMSPRELRKHRCQMRGTEG